MCGAAAIIVGLAVAYVFAFPPKCPPDPRGHVARRDIVKSAGGGSAETHESHDGISRASERKRSRERNGRG